MALEGFKYWADGEPVTGVDANTFLMSQSVMRFENASDRDSALARTLTTGMVAYLKDTTTLQIYDGTSWVDVALGTAVVTDHGALTGLNDDDHTQYLLADGTRTATNLTVSGDMTVDTSTFHVDSTNNRVGINTGSPAAPLHVNGEIIHASQWAGVSGPTSWASAYTNNWNQARDQGSFMTASSTGITINRSGRYHVISGQRANSTNDTYYGIGANGSRTALENRTTGIWSHDHSGYPNLWAKSVYIGYLAAGEKLTGGAPNSTYAGRFTFSTAGWAGFLIAHYLGD